jgi:hypothetical protein
MEWFLQFWEKFKVWWVHPTSESGGLSPPDFDLFPKLKEPLHGKRFRSIEEVSKEVT